MSHFTTVKTRITDTEALAKALADVGFKSVEVHEVAQHLHGYKGDVRRQVAEVIVRRKYVGSSSNDIGFKKRKDGTFDAIVSRYDRSKHNDKWLNSLTQRYAYHVALSKLEQQGFELASEETKVDGQVHLVLRRMG